MEKNDYKMQYLILMGSGMAFELYPTFCGEWEKDKDLFIQEQIRLEEEALETA